MKGNNATYAVRIAFGTFIISFVGIGIWQNCPGIFFQPVADSLGIGRGQFTLYLSIQNIVNMITLMFAGKILRKVNFRLLLSLSSLLAGLSFMAMSMFWSPYQFYCAGIFLGISLTFCGTMIVPILINNWFRKKVGTLIGIAMACSSLGGALFNSILSVVVQNYGWRTGYLCMGGIGTLILFPVSAFLIRYQPSDAGLSAFGQESGAEISTENGYEKLTGATTAQALRSPSFYLFFVFVIGVVFLGNITLSIPAYANSHGMPPSFGGIAASFMLIGGMFSKLALGWLNDKIGIVKSVMVALTLGLIGVGFLILANTAGASVLLAGAALLGSGYALSTVEPPIVTRKLFGSKDYNTIFSYITCSVFLTGALASPIYNAMYDRQKSYIPAFSFAIAAALIGFVCLLLALKSGKRLTEQNEISE